MKNKKVITVIVCTILVFILVRACTNALNKQIRNDIEKETIKIVSNEFAKDWHASIGDLLSEDIDFDEFPLSINFRNKYKTIQDIFGRSGKEKYIFENFYFDSYDESMSNIITIIYKTENGFEEIAYQLHYIINENNELDDIEILKSRVYREEDGHYPKYTYYRTYNQNSIAALFCLTIPKRSWDDGAVTYLTDNYINHHKDYKTESIIPWKDWLYLDESTVKQDDENDRIWYVEVVNTKEVRKYKIEFIIDENDYVDDYIIEEIERREVIDKEAVLDDYYTNYDH